MNNPKKDTQLGDKELFWAVNKDGRRIQHWREYKKEHGLDDYGRRIMGRMSTNGYKLMSGKVSKTSGKR